MPPPALPHSETLAGPEPNRPPQEIRTAGPAITDPLQQFTSEAGRLVLMPLAVSRQPIEDEFGTKGSHRSGPLFRWSPDLPIPGWLRAIVRVPVPGVNVPLRSFICGVALGALAMWLLGVSPVLYGRLRQPAASADASRPVPSAAPPAASVTIASGDPSARDVNLPAEPTHAEAGLNDQAGVPAARVARPGAGGASARQAALVKIASALSIASAPVAPRPAPVRPVAFRGSLIVRSEPPGARVFVRGQPVGVTPVVLSDVPIGSRAVHVEADGYQAWSAAVQVVANQQTQVTARLDRTTPETRP